MRVRGVTYQKLDLVGKGGSSKVFKVVAPNRKILALKRVEVCSEEEVKGFKQEITLLEQLKGKRNIIQMVDWEVGEGAVLGA